MIKEKTRKINEKGQTLLFVVVAVTIALAVGASVSSRTLNSLRRVSRSDTSSRVMAAAEGGIENLLKHKYTSLELAMTPSEVNCSAVGASFVPSRNRCVYVFSLDETISSQAVVTVERFSTNEDNGGYSFSIDPDMVKEVSLVGYGSSSINVCWENINSAIYYYSYNQDGDVVKGGMYNLGISVNGSMLGDFDSSLGSAVGSFPYCKSVNLVSNPYGLRIRVLYNSSKVAVFPDGGSSLPEQGYKFTSIGELTSSDSIDETVTVIVHKSFPYASPIFDYGIYTPQMLQ